jgi:hypothetical protein
MLVFLLQSNAELGICHLEKLRNLEDNPDFLGTEGRAAAPFTYAMVHDEAYVDYAIEMMEGCDNWICMWTSKLSPFKPIGQILTLAEFHGIKAAMAGTGAAREEQLARMNELLDRAAALGEERGYPFMAHIEEVRRELPTRSYTDGMGLGRSPPIPAPRSSATNRALHRSSPALPSIASSSEPPDRGFFLQLFELLRYR